jgi:hypothetical protein
MTPAANLGLAILASMKQVEAILLFVFEHATSASSPKPSQNETTQILRRLDQARDNAKEEFANLFQEIDGNLRNTDDIGLALEASDQSHFLVSLIEARLYIYLSQMLVNRNNTVFLDGQ